LQSHVFVFLIAYGVKCCETLWRIFTSSI